MTLSLLDYNISMETTRKLAKAEKGGRGSLEQPKERGSPEDLPTIKTYAD